MLRWKVGQRANDRLLCGNCWRCSGKQWLLRLAMGSPGMSPSDWVEVLYWKERCTSPKRSLHAEIDWKESRKSTNLQMVNTDRNVLSTHWAHSLWVSCLHIIRRASGRQQFQGTSPLHYDYLVIIESQLRQSVWRAQRAFHLVTCILMDSAHCLWPLKNLNLQWCDEWSGQSGHSLTNASQAMKRVLCVRWSRVSSKVR